MTRDEAIQGYMVACHEAIKNDQAVRAAGRRLACHGIRIESVKVSCDVSLRPATPPVDDESFLRKLRITPDLEVRE